MLELEIESLDAMGKGVARNEGKVTFVDGALGGERVLVERVHSGERFDTAHTHAVLRSAPGRRAPDCPHFGTCGGCATQHADARTQMAAKQRGLEENFARIGKVAPESMLPIVYGEEWGYRHRARLSVRHVPKKGGALVGFRERRSSYVAEMLECPVLPPAVSALIPALRLLIGTLEARARTPQIEVAVGDLVTVLVFRNLDPLSAGDEAKLRAFADASGVQVWMQPKGPDGAYPLHPLDAPALDYALPQFGVRIAFRPTDFTQVNHAVNQVLVARAVRLLDPQPGERIADLFCGLGNFSLPLARSGASVTGFEGNEGLVERARQNAAANGVRATFMSANLFAPGFEVHGPFDKLLIDPPREGAIEVIKALPEGWPRKIVYVSCDPATLARDAGTLVHVKGYRLAAAGVVNMFPHTAHVESIALFEKQRASAFEKT
ncbi:MAG: 23S rRNA (uracil(1939)-C(5))-methyltransferase RlmD [Betaproteobacteria bacterium]|nr:23S rRNA (uracil(1939)-C(5))-methyltransferase RlmD [Betaproteobacteria bacterium]